MKLVKALFASATVAAVMMTSCSGPGDKPITEHLSDKEMQQLSSNGYHAEVLGLHARLTPEMKEKMKGMTYKTVNAYVDAFFKGRERAETAWQELYQSKLDSVPLIMRALERKVEENLPDKKYATVDWKTSLSEEGRLIDKADIVFTITPKQPIEEFFLTYGLVSKEDSSTVKRLSTLINEHNTVHGKDLTKPSQFKAVLNYRDADIDEDDFNRLTSKQLKDKYYWVMKVRMKVNGEWHSRHDYVEQLPMSMRLYWRDRISSPSWEPNLKEMRTREVAEEYFGIEIPDKQEYINSIQEEIAKEQSTELYELLSLTGRGNKVVIRERKIVKKD